MGHCKRRSERGKGCLLVAILMMKCFNLSSVCVCGWIRFDTEERALESL